MPRTHRLTNKLGKMNAAQGNAKVEAMASVVSTLAQQHMQMRMGMMGMQGMMMQHMQGMQGMMGHGMMGNMPGHAEGEQH